MSVGAVKVSVVWLFDVDVKVVSVPVVLVLPVVPVGTVSVVVDPALPVVVVGVVVVGVVVVGGALWVCRGRPVPSWWTAPPRAPRSPR